MNSQRQRDAMDELLRQNLPKQEDAVPAEACLEADLLAAWIDGALTRAERVKAESHAAGCSRCQAMLSSMARTAPAASRRRWWTQAATVRWLVPITAVVAVALWVAAPPASRAPAQMTATPADRVSGSSAPSMAAPPAAPSDERARTVRIAPALPRGAVPERDDAASRAASTATSKLQKSEARLDESKDAQTLDALNFGIPALPDQSALRRQAPPLLPRAEPAATPSPSPRLLEAPLLTAAQPAAPPPPPPAPVRDAAARAEARPAAGPRAAGRPTAMSESIAQAAPALGFSAGRGGNVGLLDIVSTDRAVRWRLGGIASVQRSTDGGVTWTTQQTGTTILLSAGSSPSIQVCWLVGRAGTVLLSTDGATWQLRPFPEGVDLIGVRATDAKTAIVTTADARRFATADGGATWAPAQESPAAPFSQ